MKKSAIILTSIIVLCFCGCVNPLLYGRHPREQPGTTWKTEDGQVSFSVSNDDMRNITGIISTEDGGATIQLHAGLYSSVFEVTYKVYEHYENQLIVADEVWNTCSVTKNKFVVEIIESNYFEEGEELVFYKVK